MAKQTVYRIEHIDSKIGPYRHLSSAENRKGWMIGNHTERTGQPGPTYDWKLMKSAHKNCYDIDRLPWNSVEFAFVSWKQLRKWFNRVELELLLQSGFVVRKYQAKVIAKSPFQCLVLV